MLLRFRFIFALYLPMIAGILVAPPSAQPQAQPNQAPATAVGTPPPEGWTPSTLRKGAELWYASGRRSPDQYPSAWHLYQARQQARRLWHAQLSSSNANQSAVIGGSWQFAGPLPLNTSGSTSGGVPVQDYGNISGRVSTLALDPGDPTGNTLWVGAANGGVWKCTHALSSATCTAMTDAQTSLSIGSIAISPSSGPIYVGTGEADCCSDLVYGQGILTSTNGGSTWTLVTSADGGMESFFGLAFSRILIDPANPQIIVASAQNGLDGFTGAGTPTALQGQTFNWEGIYRSTNAGVTWSLAFPPTTGGDAGATDIAYDSNCGCYYAAFSGNGLFKSTDQGATWSPVNASPFPSGAAVSLTSNGTVTNFSTAKISIRGGVMYSVIVDNTGDLSAPSPCATGQTTGCDTGIQQSTDGGQTWTPISVPATNAAGDSVMCETTSFGKDCQGNYDIFLLAPPGGTNLVLGGLDAYATTTVSGMSTSWTDIENSYSNVAGLVHGDNHALVALNNGTWFVGTDGGVWATENSGSAWSNLNATLGITQFYTVTADPVNSGVWLSGAQDNGTSKSSASTATWDRVMLGDGGFTAISTSNEAEYFAEFPGAISRFDDAADTMTNNFSNVVDTSFTKDAEAFYQPYHLLPHDQSTIIMGTCRVWEGPTVTATDGAGWATISNDLTGGGSGSGTCQKNGDVIRDLEAASTSANPKVDSVIYAVTTDDHVAVSQNANSAAPTFTDVSGNGLPQDGQGAHPFSSVAINPANSAIAYVTALGFGMGHIFKTSNYGGSWTDITGNLPDAPANWVAIDPLNTNDIYLATDTGVYVATDGGVSGETWQQMGSGLPQADALQLTISATSPRMLAAATHGRGLWTIAPLQASGSANPDFTVTASPSTQSVAAGSNASLTVSTSAVNGDTASISLTCTTPVSGCSFSPSSVTPGNSSTLTVAASALVAASNTVTISATDGTNTHTASATVDVSSGSGGTGSLTGQIVAFAGGGATAPSTSSESLKQALLISPGGLASGGGGGFVITNGGSQVDLVNPVAGTILLAAGCGTNSCGPAPSTTPQPAVSVSLWSSGTGGATAVAVDANGNFYIADNASNHLDKVDTNDQITIVAGCSSSNSCTGYPGLTPKPAIGASLESVTGVAIDSSGNMYISDSLYGVVYKVTASTMQIQIFAGGGASTPSSSPQAATSVALGNPTALTLDGSGNLYIASASSQGGSTFVYKMNLSTGQLIAWAGNGYSVGSPASSTSQSATSVGMFPTALATDSSANLYIASQVNGANLVLKVDTNDNLVLLAGGGNATPSYTPQPATGVNISPNGLTFDPAGDLYISDNLNNFVLVMPSNTAPVPDFSVAASPATQSVTAGSNATLTIKTSAINGDAASISLSCTAPASGCSFSPGTVSPGGSSTLTVAASALAVGSDTITVSASDGTNTHTASATVTVTSAAPNFTMTLTPENSTIAAGANATIAVATTAVNGDAASLSFQCTQPASGCSFSPASVTPGSSSTLTVSASALTAGSNTISVRATDGTNTQTANTTITVTSAPDFSMSALPSTATVSPGQSATYTITLTPANGFNSAVSLTCSGAPSNANCTFSPVSVTPSGSSVTSTLTITTTAPSAIAAGAIRAQAGIAMPPTSGHGPWRYAFLGAGLASLLLLRRKRHSLYTRWLTIGVLALFVGALSSCSSGGGGNGGGSGPSNPGTPAGSSTIAVTGTSGSLSHSTSVTLVVN